MRCLLFYAAFAAILSLFVAEAFTDCNAFKGSCPSNNGTTESHLTYDFTQASDVAKWITTTQAVTSGADGAQFVLKQHGDDPTLISDFYIFYGEVSVELKIAPGAGVVSTFFFMSDDGDEVDWEALGGYNDKVQTNYFGKGDTSDFNRWTWQPVTTPQSVFHKYTLIWAKDKLSWALDGNIVRTVTYADAQGGTRYPQTPARIRLGIWAGGDPSESPGTIEWAGGKTDFSKGPFTMYVKSVEIINYNPAESYSYSDKSGSSDSIKINGAAPGGKDTGSDTSGTSGTLTKMGNTGSSESTSSESKLTTDPLSVPGTLLTYSSDASRTTVFTSVSTFSIGSPSNSNSMPTTTKFPITISSTSGSTVTWSNSSTATYPNVIGSPGLSSITGEATSALKSAGSLALACIPHVIFLAMIVIIIQI